MAATLTRRAESKQQLARRVSDQMGLFSLRYCPRAKVVNIDRLTVNESFGHLYELFCEDVGEFPDFAFEVWIDDRDNGGDIKQTIVDELTDIVRKYVEVVNRVAERLNRKPKGGAI